MDTSAAVTPTGAVTENTAGSTNLAQQIADMMAAAKRNPQAPEGSVPPPAGSTDSQPVAPGDEESDGDIPVANPEDNSETTDEDVSDEQNTEAPTEVSDVVDMVEFAKANPTAKFRIPNKDAKGGFVEITADKAASIIGQSSAITVKADKLKEERAAFEEEMKERVNHINGLTIAFETELVPELASAADELVKVQQWQATWQQHYDNNSNNPDEQAKAIAAMQKNETVIAEISKFIKDKRPKVQQFYDLRAQQMQGTLEQARKGFKDESLKNTHNFSELRKELENTWANHKEQMIPGVSNLDLISSDETLLSLLRDGLKFRKAPKGSNAGKSPAAATKSTSKAVTKIDNPNADLEKRAQSGDRKAGESLLASYLSQQRGRKR